MTRKQDEQYTAEETAKRADAAIRRALNTPHKPHKPLHKVDARRKKPMDKKDDDTAS